MAVEDRLGGGRLRLQHRPIRDVAVPLDERRDRPAPTDDDLEQLPDRVGDRAVVAVDEQKIALVVGLLGVPGKMDLADMVERKVGEIVVRRSSRDWWRKRRRC